MIYKFTGSSENALKIANDIAITLSHKYIGTEHILYGLIKEGTGIGSKVLEEQNITPEAVMEKIEELVGRRRRKNKRNTEGLHQEQKE